MKKILLYVLCLGIAVPQPLHASSLSREDLETLSQAAAKRGIRFFDGNRQETSFAKWAHNPLPQKERLEVLLPSTTFGLKHPVSAKMKTLSATAQGIAMQLTLTDLTENRVFSRQKLVYDFTRPYNRVAAIEPSTGLRWLTGIIGLAMSVASVNAWKALKYMPAVKGRLSMIAAIITLGGLGFSYLMAALFPSNEYGDRPIVELSSRG